MQFKATVDFDATDEQRRRIASIDAGQVVTTLADKPRCRAWVELYGKDRWEKEIVGQYQPIATAASQ